MPQTAENLISTACVDWLKQNCKCFSKLLRPGYFEEITRDNLQLVKKLRAENERTAADNKRLKKEIDYMAAQNAKIREPLQEQEALK